MQTPRAIFENQLENGLGMLSEPFYAEGHDSAVRDGRFMKLEFRNAAQLLTIFVTMGPMQQQILHRANPQPPQLCRPLRANAR